MFGRILVNTCLTIIVLFAMGCGASFSSDSGFEPSEVVDMDGEFELSVKIEKEDVLGVDMREPFKGGYKVVGASFDPDILSMVHFLRYDDDGERRVQYMFKPEADGTTDVLFKMEPLGGSGSTEIYKRVTVNVGDDSSIF